ncbi:MAG: hypothetical protein R3B07_31675, partial [Polyangiaceae bacterium]
MKRLASTLFCVLLLIPAAAQAQTDPPNVEKILGFVRWTGVLVSLGVIVGAGLLVRFINNVVVSLGDRFTNRRLTFQKIESFLRFAIYIITGAVVIALSFRL